MPSADAAAPKRRGRPVQLPNDLSPMRSRVYDPWTRSAWLLAVSRTFGGDGTFASRAAFVEALHTHGHSGDLSRVSRWESGQQALPATVFLRYEQTLGLPRGSLLATARTTVRRAEPRSLDPGAVEVSRNDQPPDALSATLLERVLDPDEVVDGGDWLVLALEIARFDLVLLPSQAWGRLCARLLNELARTRGVDRLRRQEAALTLVQHPIAQRHVLHALGLWLTHPHVQVVDPMMALLEQLPGDPASTLVLRLADAENPVVAGGALRAASVKLARGHLSSPALALLELRVIRELVGTSGRGIDLMDVITHLPADSYRRVHDATSDPRVHTRMKMLRETCTTVSAEVARSSSRAIAGQVQAQVAQGRPVEPDQLLQRLVREALFHVHGARRQAAGDLLMASPYADAVAEAVIPLAVSETAGGGSRAWELVSRLGFGTRRADLAALAASDRPGHRRQALLGLGLHADRLQAEESEVFERLVRRPGNRRDAAAAVAGLGLAAPERLPAHEEIPDLIRRGAAAWWTDVGRAIRDRDSHA